MSTNIEGKVIVITGASSGLGAATAKRLASDGAKVVLGARRLEKLNALAEEIRKEHGEVAVVKTDVTDLNQVKSLVNTAFDKFGRLDVIINNAGLMPVSPLEKLHVEEWDRMIDVNIKGVLYGIAAALPALKKQKSGQIINVSSVAGHKTGPGMAVYSATKSAVRTLSEALRQEVKPYNIRTTVISPGAVDTELPDTITDEDSAMATKETYRVAIDADSFARAVVFAIEQPADMDVNEILYRPIGQQF